MDMGCERSVFDLELREQQEKDRQIELQKHRDKVLLVNEKIVKIN